MAMGDRERERIPQKRQPQAQDRKYKTKMSDYRPGRKI